MAKLSYLAIAVALAAGGWLAYSVSSPEAAVEDRDVRPRASREFGGESPDAPEVGAEVRHDTQRAKLDETAPGRPKAGRERVELDRFLDPDAQPTSGFTESVSDAGQFLRPEDHPAPGGLVGGASDVGEYLDPDASIGEYPEADESIWGAFAQEGEG